MKRPELIVMAAGMGSRYGGLKQLDPMDEDGHTLMDFSLYDAKRAGFQKVIFVINHAIDSEFQKRIGERIRPYLDVDYAYQEVDSLPEGFPLPEGREKPFGTAQAILCCREKVRGPFAVINADDYYGVHAFQEIYGFLDRLPEQAMYRYAMVGYDLNNTLTENGSVSRGICEIDRSGNLSRIRERLHVEMRDNGAAYTEDGGNSWTFLPPDTTVSMNLFGFTPDLFQELQDRFPLFLEKGLQEDPLKCEYFLPGVVGDLIDEQKASVHVLHTPDHWYGVTYQQDKQRVIRAIRDLKELGIYPKHLWEEE